MPLDSVFKKIQLREPQFGADNTDIVSGATVSVTVQNGLNVPVYVTESRGGLKYTVYPNGQTAGNCIKLILTVNVHRGVNFNLKPLSTDDDVVDTLPVSEYIKDLIRNDERFDKGVFKYSGTGPLTFSWDIPSKEILSGEVCYFSDLELTLTICEQKGVLIDHPKDHYKRMAARPSRSRANNTRKRDVETVVYKNYKDKNNYYAVHGNIIYPCHQHSIGDAEGYISVTGCADSIDLDKAISSGLVFMSHEDARVSVESNLKTALEDNSTQLKIVDLLQDIQVDLKGSATKQTSAELDVAKLEAQQRVSMEKVRADQVSIRNSMEVEEAKHQMRRSALEESFVRDSLNDVIKDVDAVEKALQQGNKAIVDNVVNLASLAKRLAVGK